jgi:starch phosphorylase
VYFGRLHPDAIRVELFANGQNGAEPVRKPMDQGSELPDGGILYSACVEPTRNANDFTPRIVPYHTGASLPLEASQILWQR